jgi:hypothetical protein
MSMNDVGLLVVYKLDQPFQCLWIGQAARIEVATNSADGLKLLRKWAVVPVCDRTNASFMFCTTEVAQEADRDSFGSGCRQPAN